MMDKETYDWLIETLTKLKKHCHYQVRSIDWKYGADYAINSIIGHISEVKKE